MINMIGQILRLVEIALTVSLAIMYISLGESLPGSELGEAWLLIAMLGLSLRNTHFIIAITDHDCIPCKIILSLNSIISGSILFALSQDAPPPFCQGINCSTLHRVVLWTGRSLWMSSAGALLVILVAFLVVRVMEWVRRRRFENDASEISYSAVLDYQEDLQVISYDNIENDLTCCICLSNAEMGERLILLPNCEHKFHKTCLMEWLAKKRQCPYCKASV